MPPAGNKQQAVKGEGFKQKKSKLGGGNEKKNDFFFKLKKNLGGGEIFCFGHGGAHVLVSVLFGQTWNERRVRLFRFVCKMQSE